MRLIPSSLLSRFARAGRRTVGTLLLLLVGLPAQAGPDAGQTGALRANTEVSALGASTYELPIQVPPGIVGVEPLLSLQYNSQQGEGIAGLGMSLTGLSIITRCPATTPLDGYVGSVNFNDRDRFCLDGARLIAVKGRYGQDGSEYRTESESWTRVVARGVCGSGPCSFQAWNKAGWALAFGTTADSRPGVPGASEIVSWQIARSADLNGNAVTVHYSTASDGLQNLPAQIRYTENPAQGMTGGSRAVSFDYEPRPDRMPRYIGGQRFLMDKRLTRIRTSADGAAVLDYRLGYAVSATTRRSLLDSVTVCPGGGSGDCLAPTRFTWQAATPDVRSPNGSAGGLLASDWCSGESAVVDDADFNGDGRPDLLCTREGEAWVLVSTGTQARPANNRARGQLNLTKDWCAGKDRTLGWTDFNGDRKTDVVCASGDSTFKVMASTGSDVISVNGRSGGLLSTPPQWCEASRQCRPRFVNFDGDGRGDLACDCEDGDHRVLVSTGSDVRSPNNSPLGQVASQFCSAKGATTSWGDFNGDGQSDLFCHDHGRQSVLVSTGTQLVSPNQDARGVLRNNWCAGPDDQIGSADFNGDGLADLSCRQANGSIQVLLSTGKGLAGPNDDANGLVRAGWCTGSDSRLSWGDFNGDGLADAFCHEKNGRQSLMVSTGTQLVPGNNSADGLIRANWCQGGTVRAGNSDFNGDALADLICADSKGGQSVLVHSAGAPDLLSTVTNGLGGGARFSYRPMTDDAVYRDGDKVAYPTLDIRTPLYLVDRYTPFDGRGNDYPNALQYKGARTQVELRRWLGFQEVRRTRLFDGRYSLTRYLQQYPLTGFMEEVGEYAADGALLSRGNFVPQVLNPYPGVYATLRASERSSTFTAGKADYVSEKRYRYDEYGNPLLTQDLGDAASPADDLFDCWHYRNDPVQWRLGYIDSHRSTRSEAACNAFLQDPQRRWDESVDLRWERTGYDAAMNPLTLGAWDDQNKTWLTQTKGFDGFGNMVSMTDWAGQTTRLEVDPGKTYVVSVTSPALDNGVRLKTRSAYQNGFGNRTLEVDANGNEQRSEFDGLGRRVREFGPRPGADSGAATTLLKTYHYGQDAAGYFVETRERSDWAQEDTARWPYSRLYVDGLSRPLRTVRSGPAGGADVLTEQVYDAAGRLGRSSFPRFVQEPAAWVSYLYDNRDRPTRMTQPDGTVQTVDYLQGELKVRTTLAAGTADERSTLRESSVRDALLRTTASNGAVVSYQYDPLVQTRETLGPRGDLIRFRYDSLGRIVWSQSADTGEKYFRYDAKGLLARVEAPDQTVIRYEYDALGRVRRQSTSRDGEPGQRYDYGYDDAAANGLGVLTRVTGADATQSMGYDRYGRVRTETLAIDGRVYTQTSEYAPDGARTRLIYPDNAILDTAYDAVGNPTTLTFRDRADATPRTVADYRSYTAQNQVSDVVYGNGVRTRFDYYSYQEAMGRPRGLTASAGSGARYDASYDWSRMGQLVGTTVQRGARKPEQYRFRYDGMGWLAQANGPYGLQDFDYDPAGNILHKDGVTYDYVEGSNRLQGANNGLQVAHDGAGNVTRLHWPGEDWRYHYSGDGNLRAADLNGQVQTAYLYDFAGNRLKRSDASGAVSLYVSGDFDVAIHNGQTRYTRYIAGPQGRIAAFTRSDDGDSRPVRPAAGQPLSGDGLPQPGERYFHTDTLGSSAVVTDEQAQESATLAYQPFGAIDTARSEGKDDFRPKFSGMELDQPVGLNYFGARYQHPTLGRFLQPDPLSQFSNPYSYVGNDPLSLVDPDGEEIVSALVFASVVAISATAGAYSGAAAVNHEMNPAYWDWRKGKTYAGLFAGGAIGAAGGAIGGVAAEAGVAVGIVGEIAVGAVEGAAFSAMGGGSPLEIAESTLTGGLFSGISAGAGAAIGSLARSGSRMIARGEAGVLDSVAGEAGSSLGRVTRQGDDVAGRVGSLESRSLRSATSSSENPRLLSASDGQDMLGALESGCFSFPAGTRISTPDGLRNIETLRVGERVLALEAGDKVVSRPVLATHQRDASDMLDLLIRGGATLATTREHPYWTRDRGWVKAHQLQPEDHLLQPDGSELEVEAVRASPLSARVYNFEVASAHNYFAGDGEAQALVHNSKSCSARSRAVGSTPGKGSRTGREVIARMERQGLVRMKNGVREVAVAVTLGGPRVWKKMDRQIHMGHITDAVAWWNRVGYKTGAKSKTVRTFMLDSSNYELEWGPLNSSNGARLGIQYRKPRGHVGKWP